MMMRRYVFTILTALLAFTAVHAQDTNSADSPVPFFTWGARIGFAATGTYLTEPTIDGHRIAEYTQDTQVGNFSAIMLRFNSRRLLVQTGVGLSYNKSSFSLDANSWNPDAESAKEIACSYSMLSMTVPVQLGFHIVNRPPYCMSVFTGPRLRYTPDKFYSVKYQGLEPYEFTDTPTLLSIGWTAGLSVQIGRTFLDFEYEATINNISQTMYDTSGTEPVPDNKLNRRVSIISFSYGVIF